MLKNGSCVCGQSFPYLLAFSYDATATAATVTAPAAAAAEKTFSDKTFSYKALIRPSVIMSWKSLALETS